MTICTPSSLVAAATAAGFDKMSNRALLAVDTYLRCQIAQGNPTPPSNGLLNSLVAYWKMNEMDGGRADSTANNNALIDTQDNVSSAAGLLGLAARAPAEQGNQQLFNSAIAGNSAVDFKASLSIWLNLTAALQNDFILQIQSAGGDNIFYAFTQANTLHFASDAGGYTFSPADPLYLGWHHFVITQNETNWTLYINGVFIDDSAAPVLEQLGIVSFFNDVFDTSLSPAALIQQTGIWNKTLSQADVTALYNGGIPLPYESFTV